MSDVRGRLLEAFKKRAFSFGSFTLASGKTSSYYVNSKKAIFQSEVVGLLAGACFELTADLNIEAAGMDSKSGAHPARRRSWPASTTARADAPLEGFFVRKQAKGHGSQERVEGVLRPGTCAKVAVLDDVLTTGGSALQAVAEIEKAGAVVAAVVCIVDRLEGAREAIGAKHEFRPIFTIRDFGVEPPKP